MSVWQERAEAAARPETTPLISASQEHPQERPMVTLESPLIELNVFVTDERGRPVTGLRRDDFEVLEAGVPQHISTFSVERFDARLELPRSTGEDRSEQLAPGVSNRTILIVVDDLHIAPHNMLRVKRALLEFIDGDVRDGDDVVFVTPSGRLGFLQQLTHERAVMRLAVGRLMGQKTSFSSTFDRLALTPHLAERLLRRDPTALEAVVRELRAQQPLLSPDAAMNMAMMSARQLIGQIEQRALATINTLAGAIATLRRRPGSKLAIFISEGFLLSTVSTRARRRLQSVIDAATRARVVVYTVDPQGLHTTSSDPGRSPHDVTPEMINVRLSDRISQQSALQEALATIAHQTGGVAFLNDNDLQAGLRSVLVENNFYYAIGYQPSQTRSKRARFRSIRVKVKGHPRWNVRFQQGYLAAGRAKPKASTTSRRPEDRVREALAAIIPYEEIGVTARASFINVPGTGSLIIAAIHLDGRTLRFRQANGAFTATVELTGVFYDTQGKVVHSFSKKLDLNLRPPTYQDILQRGVEYIEHVRPGPGLYQMRIAVVEPSTGRLGSASQWVEIPDLRKQRLQLSDIFFLTEPPPDSPRDSGRTAPRQAEPMLIAPTRRVFNRDGWFDFGFYIYNGHRAAGSKPDLVVQIQVLQNSMPVVTSPLRVVPIGEGTDEQRIFYGRRLMLQSLAPGKYELRVIVIDRRSRQRAVKRIDFNVI